MRDIIFSPDPAVRVLVVGDLILDQYIYGETRRISPEAPVPVVRVSRTEERPGGAANVAANVAALGLGVTLLGLAGDDAAARRLTALLDERGVDCRFHYQPDIFTVTKRRVLSRQQQLLRLDYESETRAEAPAGLFNDFQALLPEADIVILSDYAKGSLPHVGQFIEYARKQGARVLVDPKSPDFACYRRASVLTPNQQEFEAVAGQCASEAELTARAAQLRAELDLEALLITRGERGMSLFTTAAPPLHLPAEAHEVYDVTGAGDTVIAALASALACGYAIGEATALANRAAGLVVEKLGAATVTLAELNQGRGSNGAGIVAEETALRLIRRARQHGGKIVLTNGCFDILHAGHVEYLAEARALGDMLVVAVNDDDSVRRLKGRQRPVNSIENRMKLLNALAAVDLVLPFAEDTPERLIARLKPDVLVKGGDYREAQIAGAASVRQNGGEVVILASRPGLSTSLTIARIRETEGET